MLEFDPGDKNSQSKDMDDRDFWLQKLAKETPGLERYGKQKPLAAPEKAMITTCATIGVLQVAAQALTGDEIARTPDGQEMIKEIDQKLDALRAQAAERGFEVLGKLTRDWLEATPDQ